MYVHGNSTLNEDCQNKDHLISVRFCLKRRLLLLIAKP